MNLRYATWLIILTGFFNLLFDLKKKKLVKFTNHIAKYTTYYHPHSKQTFKNNLTRVMIHYTKLTTTMHIIKNISRPMIAMLTLLSTAKKMKK